MSAHSLRYVKAHALRDYVLPGWDKTITGRWSYSDLISDPVWSNGWISFDALCWDAQQKMLYCGLNSIDGDLLYRFDPQTAEFESMNTRSWTDPYDVKIHRTLLLSPIDRCLYFGTSLLHDLDRQHDAKGGKIVRYDPQTGVYTVLAVPAPHLYIQSIAADWNRSIIYAFTYPAETLTRVNVADSRSTLLAYIGSPTVFAQPHNSVVDAAGWLWGTWAETRAWEEATGPSPIRLFKYHPDGNKFVWYTHGLSRRGSAEQLLSNPQGMSRDAPLLSETRHKEDYGFCDSMVFDGIRYIYAGTVAGALCRIDTLTGAVEKLANVIAAGRLPALAIRDGVLYGAGGLKGHTQLFRWIIDSDSIECFGNLVDPSINDRPARVHEIAVDQGHQLYLGENDNSRRSSFLWVIRID